MFMFEAISDNADLIVLDDPISAFDEKRNLELFEGYLIIKRIVLKRKQY